MVYTDRYSFAQPSEKPRRATAFEPQRYEENISVSTSSSISMILLADTAR